MKKFFVFALMILAGTAMDAQTVISNESLTHDGTNVTVSFDIDTDVKGIPSRRKEVIIPYIYNDKDTVYLDVVEVYGKGRYKRERQENHIAGDKDWELDENQMLKGDIYNYRAQTPLKRWMKPANLGIRRQLVGCACEKDRADENLAEASLSKSRLFLHAEHLHMSLRMQHANGISDRMSSKSSSRFRR